MAINVEKKSGGSGWTAFWISVAAGCAAVFSAYNGWYLRRSVQKERHIQNGVKVLKTSQFPSDEEVLFTVRRESLEEILRSFVFCSNNSLTTVITGARGVGKSVAVMLALKKEKKMLYVTGASSFPHFIQQFCKELCGTNEEETQAYIKSVLKRVKSSFIPTIVVDVNQNWSSKDMLELLIFCKVVSDDSHLARFLIVVSGSIISLNLTVPVDELRGIIINVKEASDSEALEYFVKCFSSFKISLGKDDELKLFTEEEQSDLAGLAIKNTGRNFLHMKTLMVEVSRIAERKQYTLQKDFESTLDREDRIALIASKKLEAIEEMKNSILKYGMSIRGRHSVVAMAFMNHLQKISNLWFFKKEFTKFVEKLLNGELIELREVETMLGVPVNDFCEALRGVRPHPVYIDSFSGFIVMESKLMKEAFRSLLHV